ncbi:MAG: 4-hydroxy-tetrahydrodipicolinate reductase [Alphaproteobacteria bacterium]
MKIAVAGCLGRMGATLIEAVQADERFTLVAGSERADYDVTDVQTQLDAYGCGNLMVSSDVEEVANAADAVIDFTTPHATLAMAEAVAKKGGVHIIGTTGFTPEQIRQLEKFAKKSRMVRAGNFSPGVAVLSHLVRQAAATLDTQYDIEIFEMHHKHKKDAPSGTALMLGEAAAQGRGGTLPDSIELDRNQVREKGTIGFCVSRGGDVVGIHRAGFYGPGEMIELSHQGFSRHIYANGALKSALWAKDKKPGNYTIFDVLGLD